MYIVTGAAGFIGSNMVKCLNDHGHKNILCVDDLDSSRVNNLAGLEFEDFVSPQDLLNINISSDTIFHLGANSKTSADDWDSIYATNVDYTRQLLGTKYDKFVFASSASVYGDIKDTVEHGSNSAPKNLYAATKYICDSIIRNQLKFSTIQSWRFFNVYGNRESHKVGYSQASPYTSFIHQARTTGKIKLFDISADVHRDFVCVDDVVEIMYQQSLHDRSFISNLGTGTTYSFQQWGELIAQHYDAKIETVPIPENIKQGYQMYTCSNNTQLRSLIGSDYQFKTPEQFVKDNL